MPVQGSLLPNPDNETCYTPKSPDPTFDVALLALASVRGVGTKALRALVERYGSSLGSVWGLPHAALLEMFTEAGVPGGRRLAQELQDNRDALAGRGRAAIEELHAKGVHVLSPDELPPRLARLKDGPRWLFVEGNPDTLFGGPYVAVVGTRAASDKGIKAAEAVVRTLAPYPIALVSGLAQGIDASAHAAAIRDDVPNIAFLGHGTDVTFPAETSHLRQRLVQAGGTVASEYPPAEHYRKQNFVQRDRLQAGLADLVVAVEGETKSGSAHTVRFATEYSRPLVGLNWSGAGGLVSLVREQPHSQIIEIFSDEGRRSLDQVVRSLAASYGHEPFGLNLVDRQLTREARLRYLKPSDLLSLRSRIDRILSEVKED